MMLYIYSVGSKKDEREELSYWGKTNRTSIYTPLSARPGWYNDAPLQVSRFAVVKFSDTTLLKKVKHECDSARCCSRTKGDATGRHLSALWATTNTGPRPGWLCASLTDSSFLFLNLWAGNLPRFYFTRLHRSSSLPLMRSVLSIINTSTAHSIQTHNAGLLLAWLS